MTPRHIPRWIALIVMASTGACAVASAHAADRPTLDQDLPLDLRDAWPAITTSSPSPHDEILLNAAPKRGAICVGDWKLVIKGTARDTRQNDRRQPDGPSVELFNLTQDIGEKNSFAPDRPALVAELQARYNRFLAQAEPPKYQPKTAAPMIGGAKVRRRRRFPSFTDPPCRRTRPYCKATPRESTHPLH